MVELYYFYDSIGNLAMIRYYTGSGEENYNYYVATNSRGDVEAIYRGNGTIKARYIYDTWGKVISVVNENGQEITSQNDIGLINPIRYRGYYYDQETGYYYLQSRYYDPDTGRFLNGDSVLDQSSAIGINLYSYCFNNPVNMIDKTGNLPFFVITAGIGAVVGAIVGGVRAAKKGTNVWAGIGVGAAAGALVGSGLGMVAGAALAGSVTATTSAVIAGGSTLVATAVTGGIGAGATYIANNLQQASTQISNAVSSISQKVVPNPPPNPGTPFQPDKIGFQYGVDPNTLTPTKDLSTLDPQRIINAVMYGGDKSIEVGRTGIILDGHHRVADAILNGRALDVFVEPFK